MDNVLPIFPLSLVVYPGEHLNLHIFEERYKQLINDCLVYHTTFGVPSFIDGKLCEFGTEVEVSSVERVYAKGEMDIKTHGLRVFKMTRMHASLADKQYAGANVEWIEPEDNGDEAFHADIVELLRELHGVLKVSKAELENAAELNTYKVAHFVGLPLEKEYQLLCMRSERERQLFLIQHLRSILPVARETEMLKERIRANGHFKHIDPPKF